MSKVYWVTGISGVGKTTFAKILQKELKNKKIKSIIIDGDEIRKILNKQDQYEKKDRIDLAMIYSKLAKLYSEQGITVIVSTISLFKKVHLWNRENLKNYVEILIKRDISEIIKNDIRNIYDEDNIVGKSIEAEYPENPEFTLNNIDINGIKNFIKMNIVG
tara:strand:+ start:14978 stop:15460 length:483 start_codon:yes stop_codon:yes gene_type:complete